MQAYILVDGAIERTRSAGVVREAHAAGRPMWVDLGQRSVSLDALLTETFRLRPLVVEDIWLDRTTPKIDDYEDYLYLAVHGPRQARGGAPAGLERWVLDIVIGRSFVITQHSDAPLREAIALALGRSPSPLSAGPAWLVHALLDHVVDRYLVVTEIFEERIDRVERDVIAGEGRNELMPTIFALKRSIRSSVGSRSASADSSRGCPWVTSTRSPRRGSLFSRRVRSLRPRRRPRRDPPRRHHQRARRVPGRPVEQDEQDDQDVDADEYADAATQPHREDLRNELPQHARALLAIWLSLRPRPHGDGGDDDPAALPVGSGGCERSESTSPQASTLATFTHHRGGVAAHACGRTAGILAAVGRCRRIRPERASRGYRAVKTRRGTAETACAP